MTETVTIKFPADLGEQIEQLAEQEVTSPWGIVRRAVRFQVFVNKLEEEGDVIVEEKGTRIPLSLRL